MLKKSLLLAGLLFSRVAMPMSAGTVDEMWGFLSNEQLYSHIVAMGAVALLQKTVSFGINVAKLPRKDFRNAFAGTMMRLTGRGLFSAAAVARLTGVNTEVTDMSALAGIAAVVGGNVMGPKHPVEDLQNAGNDLLGAFWGIGGDLLVSSAIAYSLGEPDDQYTALRRMAVATGCLLLGDVVEHGWRK